MYFPQPNNGVFTFGRDVNIHWKHGINALTPEEQEKCNRGRISIILWGLAEQVVEEPNSPSLLGADGQGPHASSKNHHNKGKNFRRNNNNRRNNTKKNNQSKQTENQKN